MGFQIGIDGKLVVIAVASILGLIVVVGIVTFTIFMLYKPTGTISTSDEAIDN